MISVCTYCGVGCEIDIEVENEKIKKIKPETEVIVTTGFGDIKKAVKALQYDASDFISKPIDDDALHMALKRARQRYIDKKQLYGFDLWKRSLSIDELGNRISGIDFGREVVLADYIKAVYNKSTYIIPISKNRLTCGYVTDEIPFNGSFSLVTNEPYAGPNSVVAMNLKYNGKYYPAVIYSNPMGYTLTTGNVVYIAFPIEEFPSKNFIKNLYNHVEQITHKKNTAPYNPDKSGYQARFQNFS